MQHNRSICSNQIPSQSCSKLNSKSNCTLVGGFGTPVHHFGDESGIVASVIRWSDGRLFLRQSHNKPFLEEVVLKTDVSPLSK